MERSRGTGIGGSRLGLEDGQGLSVQRLGIVEMALLNQNVGDVIEADGDVPMIWAESLPVNLQDLPVEGLSLTVSTLFVQHRGQGRKRNSCIGMFGTERGLLNRESLSTSPFGLAELVFSVQQHGEVVEAPCGEGIVRAEDRLRDTRDAPCRRQRIPVAPRLEMHQQAVVVGLGPTQLLLVGVVGCDGAPGDGLHRQRVWARPAGLFRRDHESVAAPFANRYDDTGRVEREGVVRRRIRLRRHDHQMLMDGLRRDLDAQGLCGLDGDIEGVRVPARGQRVVARFQLALVLDGRVARESPQVDLRAGGHCACKESDQSDERKKGVRTLRAGRAAQVSHGTRESGCGGTIIVRRRLPGAVWKGALWQNAFVRGAA